MMQNKFGLVLFLVFLKGCISSDMFLQIKASFGINHFQVKYFDEDNEEVQLRKTSLLVAHLFWIMDLLWFNLFYFYF